MSHKTVMIAGIIGFSYLFPFILVWVTQGEAANIDILLFLQTTKAKYKVPYTDTNTAKQPANKIYFK